MRNRVSLLKHYRRSAAVSRTAQRTAAEPRLRLLFCLLCGLLLGATVLPGFVSLVNRESSTSNRQSPIPPASDLVLPGRPSPALAAIFLPRHAPPGAYRLAILDAPIETARAEIMAALAAGAKVDQPPGAWAIRQSEPVEAFGEAGIYERSRLARLFTGKPAQILRAPIERGGNVVASVTLISPVPDADLTRLSPGTVAILFVVAAARAPAGKVSSVPLT
jgi:hypothetical protein